jgi:hypothetical protein
MTEDRDLQQLKNRLERLLEDALRLDVGASDDEPAYTELVHLTPRVHPQEDPRAREEDEPIGSTLDEVLREFAEALESDRPPSTQDD